MTVKYEIRILNRVVMASDTNWKRIWGKWRTQSRLHRKSSLHRIKNGVEQRYVGGRRESPEWE